MDRVKVPPLASRRLAAGRRWFEQSIGGHGLRRMREIDLDTHALALCAQQVLCVAPLIVAIGAVVQRTSNHNAGYLISRFFGLGGESQRDLERLFGYSTDSISLLALILTMVGTIVFSTSVATVQQRAFEMIWTLPRVVGFRSYLRQFVWAVMLAAYSVALILLGRFSRLFESDGPVNTQIVAGAIIQGFVTFAFYWWSQRWLLGGRVSWHALLPGGIAVGVLTTVLFRLTRWLLPGQITWQVHAYGLIGAVFILSIWLMILSAVIFAGVLLGALITDHRLVLEGGDPGVLGESPLTAAGLDSAVAALEADEQHATSGRR